MDFASWLQQAADSDEDRVMPYAPLYEVVEHLKAKFQESFDFIAVASWMRESYPGDKGDLLVETLTIAESNWRVDCMVMEDPEPMAAAAEELGEAPSTELTLVKPVTGLPELPKYPCGFVGVDGKPCTRDAIDGAARCLAHGGMILDPSVRRSLLITAYAKMQTHTEFAVDTLVDVMESGRNDLARVQAAKELLDRAGMTPENHITLVDSRSVQDDDERSRVVIDMLRERLNATRDRLQMQAIPASSTEVVEN